MSGYLIQYPVPDGFDFNEAILAMDPDKDADGLHPINLGKLVLQEPGPVPATPAGIVAMFEHYGLDIAGRGPTLGRPLSLLLTLKRPGANAAVTVVHSAVKDVASFTRRADVVIAAVGSPGIVTAGMIRPGAIVVSGGITWKGRRLIPDVDEACAEVAGWITPRLGGVGVTTVAMLLRLECRHAQSPPLRSPSGWSRFPSSSTRPRSPRRCGSICCTRPTTPGSSSTTAAGAAASGSSGTKRSRATRSGAAATSC